MAKNLKKFVNPRFNRTVDLGLLRRLMERHREAFQGFDLAVFEGPPEKARKAVQEFFAGPEDGYPEGLIIDLHQIAELGDANGLQFIIEQAKQLGVNLSQADGEGSANEAEQDPKHVALRVFLDYRKIFDAAIAMLAYRTVSSFAELAGEEEGVTIDTGEACRVAFEAKAAEIFEANLRGRYCKAQCYDDDDELNVVVTHGAFFKTTDTLEAGKERVIRFRELEHAVLRYTPATGRLRLGGIAKAQRYDIAEAFAADMLKRPGFFSAPDAHNLYTLEPVERAGFRFAFHHAFDPKISRVQIVEVQANRVAVDPRSGEQQTFWSTIVRDGRDNALARLGEIAPGIEFESGHWRLNHVVIRIHFDVGGAKPVKLTVKLKPPGAPVFKRQRFEDQVMALLRRNGIAHDRQPAQIVAAAE
ncbi:MAG: hypothetical protein HYX36_00375 [Rhizobiales bacterium]|nr:hypothetical protein [Hyphomicrobiales bacterium]